MSIYRGDCLEWLRTLEDESVDAVVTDPPYGLSAPPDIAVVLRAWLDGEHYEHGSPRKGRKNCLAHIARSTIGDAEDFKSLLGASGVDHTVPFGRAFLSVEVAVDLNDGEQSRDEDVNRPKVGTVRDDVLLNDDVASIAKGLRDLVFDLRPLEGLAACVGECSCFSLGNDSVASVVVSLAGWTDEAKSTAGVVASSGAKDVAVLRLDLGRGSAELIPTDCTDARFALQPFTGTQGVGACAGARSLAAMLEADGIGHVFDTADGAVARDATATSAPDDAATLDAACSDLGLGSIERDAAHFAFFLHNDLHERLYNPTNPSPGFMGAKWDSFVPGPLVWREVMRVLKPGGHAVVFAGTRTVDLMGMACRIAGFEARDVGRYNYYTGFPKSMDISKAIDKAAGAEREVIGFDTVAAKRTPKPDATSLGVFKGQTGDITAPATEAARQWEGHGTALKPSGEPWLLLRKPLQERTIAGQVLATGTGALNIDATRYPQGDMAWPGPQDTHTESGRFTANLYACPKASRKERERGCDSLAAVSPTEVTGRTPGSKGQNNPRAGMTGHVKRRNKHPTVKPVELMRWLCRLVTPPDGLIIDPFAGSGTTGIAATLDGFGFMGAELLDDHADIAEARIAHAQDHPEQWVDTAPGSRIAKPSKPRKRKPKQQTLKGFE